MLPAGKGGLENTSKSPPGRTLGLDHSFPELLFLRISFRDPLPRNCFSNFVLCLVSVGVEIVLERPVIMKEQEEGGNSLEHEGGYRMLVCAPVSWDRTFTCSPAHIKLHQLGLLLTDRQQRVKEEWPYRELWRG